jgi:hypothetical protein
LLYSTFTVWRANSIPFGFSISRIHKHVKILHEASQVEASGIGSCQEGAKLSNCSSKAPASSDMGEK